MMGTLVVKLLRVKLEFNDFNYDYKTLIKIGQTITMLTVSKSSQQILFCSKSKIETLEKGEKWVQS